MTLIRPSDVWLIDLGYTAKIRPCLILSDPPNDDELALVIVIPHTTSVRGNRWELKIPKPFLKSGVFHLQQIQPVSLARLDRKLGELSADESQRVKMKIVDLLRLGDSK